MFIPKYKIQLVKEKSIKYEAVDKKINSPDTANNIVRTLLENETEEVFMLVAVDTKCKVIGVSEVSRGSLNASIVHPREVFKRAMMMNAANILVAHNHPSGDPTPNTEDIDITKRLDEAGRLLGIGIMDHIIIGDESYSSLKDKNLF